MPARWKRRDEESGGDAADSKSINGGHVKGVDDVRVEGAMASVSRAT